jgi:plasmid stabilization system protein ParE
VAEVVIARRAAAEAIDARIMRLRSFPRLGPLRVAPDTRELRVRFGRYGYIVRCVLRDEIVVVTRIFHGREDR